MGSAAPTNIPGGRYGAYAWTDGSGNFWLYGGNGFDAGGVNAVYLNDLWKYTPNTNGTPGSWTWMSGSSSVPPGPAPWILGAEPGVYGTIGTPDPANVPRGHSSGVAWADASGNLWLFGGLGADSAGNSGYLNDLWMYTPGARGMGQWKWMGGSNIIPVSSASQAFGVQCGQPGVYGTLGVTAAANTPGARIGAVPWVDATGNIWLFGGQGYDASGSQGYLSDSWKYQP